MAPRRRRTPAAASAEERHPYLVFAVAGEPFALALQGVDRIVRLEGYAPTVHAPTVHASRVDAPAVLKGLMELPSRTVAVLDLSAIFARGAMTPSVESCVLVVAGTTDGPTGGPACGLLVEGARGVLELTPSEIAAPPRAGGLFAARWIAGMARGPGGFVPILDLAGLLDSPELRAALRAAVAAPDEPKPTASRGRRRGRKSA